MVAKSYIHTLKPQIQSIEPRKRRLGIRTMPYVFGEERRIKKLGCIFFLFLKKMFFCMFFGVWKRENHLEKPGREQNSEKM